MNATQQPGDGDLVNSPGWKSEQSVLPGVNLLRSKLSYTEVFQPYHGSRYDSPPWCQHKLPYLPQII